MAVSAKLSGETPVDTQSRVEDGLRDVWQGVQRQWRGGPLVGVEVGEVVDSSAHGDRPFGRSPYPFGIDAGLPLAGAGVENAGWLVEFVVGLVVGGADVMSVGAADYDEPRSDGLRPVGGCTKLLRGSESDAVQRFRVAIGSDGREALPIVFVVAKDPKDQAASRRGNPVRAGCISPKSRRVGLTECRCNAPRSRHFRAGMLIL